MYILKIPSNVNKFDFVTDLLKKLQSEFVHYEFMNCTESPINEYNYFKHNRMYYRKIEKDTSIIINEANYTDSYEKENLKKQGISLQEYIEMCMLFELEKIMIISKFDMQIDDLKPLVTMLVCPDGWDEIHFIGQDMLLNDIIMLFR